MDEIAKVGEEMENLSKEERELFDKIAPILKESNLSYRQKNTVLLLIDRALYTILINA
ncbi:hypothetical protein [Leuconostoc falkenbergense]|uniref:hypothetical protein n=1 Tax=Leuconostoc falkenbergense TaxID=2766470 RepID=UPI0028B0876E|nr:hypothetical protein [Leuconostoc falkenbergense]